MRTSALARLRFVFQSSQTASRFREPTEQSVSGIRAGRQGRISHPPWRTGE